jgi:hypothetical protein
MTTTTARAASPITPAAVTNPVGTPDCAIVEWTAVWINPTMQIVVATNAIAPAMMPAANDHESMDRGLSRAVIARGR